MTKVMKDETKMQITVIDEVFRNEWLSNLINRRIKNPKWNYKAWRIIHHLKKIPWIGNKIRGKSLSRNITKEIQ